MFNYKVVEIFESINGEGKKAGQLALFIRFQKCNLNCSYCDTKWANSDTSPYTLMSLEELYNKVVESGIKNITITKNIIKITVIIGIIIFFIHFNPLYKLLFLS